MESATPRRSFKVLALDGGGIRGVCPAAYLTSLEEQVGTPLHRYFDLVAGTSTGGIIATALALGVPMADVLALYRDRGRHVFSRRHPRLPRMVAMAFDSLYRSEPLHAELRRVLGDDALLGKSRTRLCIPAVNITTGRVNVFKTRHHPDFERDHLLPAWQVAAATAAAPTFFDPVEIPNCGLFVDGGLWANNPAVVAVLEGRKLGYELHEIEVLSIGTGEGVYHRAASIEKGIRRLRTEARHGALLGWGTSLVSLVGHAQSDSTENLMRYLLDGRHVRVQFRLPDGDFDLDAVHQTETLARMAFEEAKRTARSVRERFFAAEVAAFEPIPMTLTPPPTTIGNNHAPERVLR